MLKLIKLALIAIVVLVVAGAGYWFYTNTDVSVNQEKTSTTATQIESFKEIGQWEFLAISSEEIVDTVVTTGRKMLGLSMGQSTRHLARIYTGTLHIGIDLQEDTKDNPEWIKMEADSTLSVTLPRPHLLDENFIDEAATRALIEKGPWTHEEKGQLTAKAQRQIKHHCLSPMNMERAEKAAVEQVGTLLKTMGFEKVKVTIER